MTFETIEESVESGQPIELYDFAIGTDHYRFTSSQNDVTLVTTAHVYTAVPISRSERVDELNSPDSNRLTITMPADEEFVQLFRDIAPGAKASLTITRLHRADLGGSEDSITVFAGTVRNVSFLNDGRIAVLQCLPVTSAYSRPTPRQTYQGSCNAMLYDAKCGIDKDDPLYRFIGTVSAVNGDVITVTGAAAFNVLTDFFEAGYIEFNHDFRTVVAQSGDDLTVITPFITDPTGLSVTCRAGCKLRMLTDCDSKFNNKDRFRGFPYVPKKNPFQTGLD